MKLLPCILLLAVVALAQAAEPEYDCKRELAVWKGKTVEELIVSYGEPADRKEKGNGKQVLTFHVGSPEPAKDAPSPADDALEPEPKAVSPREVDDKDRPGAEMTFSKGKLEKTEWKVEGKGLPTAFVFFVDAEGKVTKSKCRY